MLSETIDQTSPHLSAALDGVARFSDTIGKRDEQIKTLLANANKIAGVLGNRSEQINALLVNAQTLLAAINERSYAVSVLLERVGQFSRQVEGLINDNPNLNHVLEQLRTVSDMLVERKYDFVDVLTTLSKFTASLAEAIASGPVLQGDDRQPAAVLAPAAVRRRRVQEARHRSRGVLAQRGPARRSGSPIPNGTRFPNGAPPPAPMPFSRALRSIRVPAVVAGTPCSYTPAPERCPPGDPLPCATCRRRPVRATTRTAPNYDGRPEWWPVAAEPERSAVSRRASRLRPFPGELPPDMPGAPVPLPPAPPGARTVPLAPQPGPRRTSPRASPAAAPGARRTTATTGTRAGAPAGRHAAAAGQPAVSSRPDRKGRAAAMSTIFNVRNLKLPSVSRAAVIIGTLVVVLGLVAGLRRLDALQEADHQHRGGVLPADAGAVPR